MKCSIVIASYNKAYYLHLVLRSIFAQDPPFSFECIVVDDGTPNESTHEVCRKFPVYYHRVGRESGFKNQSHARNVGYRAARGEVVISQSDDTVHISPNCIQHLVDDLQPGTFLVANVFNTDEAGNKINTYGIEYTGPTRQVPFFFLGSLFRSDLYSIGGNDEDFMVAPGYEDNWFGDCLRSGANLMPVYSSTIVGHHLDHPRPSYSMELSAEVYRKKVEDASKGKIPWCASGGPWEFPVAKAFPSQGGREAVSPTASACLG